MKYLNIIFDFDGTLADTSDVILETMRLTVDKLGLPTKTQDEYQSMIGYRLEEIPTILWPDLETSGYASTYREIFNSIKHNYSAHPYPEVLETLKTLHSRGVNMGVASSRSRASLEEYMADLGIAQYFAQLVGGNDVSNGKPDPEPVNLILSTQNWDANRTLVVGDMNVDILMGQRAGAYTAGVTYGNGSEKSLREANATHILHNFGELANLV